MKDFILLRTFKKMIAFVSFSFVLAFAMLYGSGVFLPLDEQNPLYMLFSEGYKYLLG
ncbi:hypothetical protein [Flammeovirga pacifica]|uniref:hypothetical protein n=1 Tax=Flammeovirga pacifica TaxID=915059 RepID=UPI0013014F63|nr:hypothetical protein [Flammeovirga pacifica]